MSLVKNIRPTHRVQKKCWQIFSVRYMLSPVRLSVVCNVRPPYSTGSIFRNISMPFGTLVIHWHSRKILRRSSHGNSSVGGLNARGVAKYSDFLELSEAICRKRCKMGVNLVLIANRKSYMSFRLVPKSMTLNNLERRNGPYFALFRWTR